MFGHLKAEDFTNLIEGIELPSGRHSHLQSCTRCMDAFVSAQSLHTEISKSTMDDQNIPEPDWFQFRNDVRTAMLSRAAQRQPKAMGWSVWLMRPAMTWGLTVAFAAGLSAGLLIWNHQGTIRSSGDPQAAEQLASLDTSDVGVGEELSLESGAIDLGITTWSQTSVFDEISQLDDVQVEKLQRLLEADANQVPSRQ